MYWMGNFFLGGGGGGGGGESERGREKALQLKKFTEPTKRRRIGKEIEHVGWACFAHQK